MSANPATLPAGVSIPLASRLFQARLVATFSQWPPQSLAPTPQGARRVNVLAFLRSKPLRGRCKKKQKKLTNVSLYVCMSAGNSEMLVFISVFSPPTMHIFQDFVMVAWGKKQKKVFYGLCNVCMSGQN